MEKSKFTKAQIAFALQRAESGTRVPKVCRKMGISDRKAGIGSNAASPQAAGLGLISATKQT